MKRGQEEIVGFVVVLVLVCIVLLIVLSFSLRSTPKERVSVELGQLLSAMAETSTSCEGKRGSLTLGELYNACIDQKTCEDGAGSCLVLNQSLDRVLRLALKAGVDRPVKGYVFTVSSVRNLSTQESVRVITKRIEGNCSGSFQRGASDVQPSQGSLIRLELHACY